MGQQNLVEMTLVRIDLISKLHLFETAKIVSWVINDSLAIQRKKELTDLFKIPQK